MNKFDKKSAIVWTFMGMLIYQNFDFATPARIQPNVQKVNESVRTEHARELLGGSFRGSAAERAGRAQLNMAIFDQFKHRLPEKDKWQASTLSNLVIEESSRYGLDPVFIMAVIAQESGFRPNAVGPVGEIGLMQLRPSTAEWIATRSGYHFWGAQTLYHPFVNIKLGIAYVANLRYSFSGRASQYVSAYNIGARNVRRLAAVQRMPRTYNLQVMKKYQDMYASFGQTRPQVIVAKNMVSPYTLTHWVH